MQSGKLLKVLAVSAAAAAAITAYATHSWGNYHWGRTANPFTLKLGDNVDGNWDSYLATTSADWSQSTVLDTTVVAGRARPRTCRPTSGRVEVCNTAYGNTGWLGIAQIWTSSGHIAQGTVKVNDTYFNTATYNTAAWRNMVMCQEVGHTFGLAHQDENFNNGNLGSCMDYTNDPSTNQHPNQHDYQMLEQIYAHLDSVNTIASSTAAALPAQMLGRDFDTQRSWGQLMRRSRDGARETYVRDFGHGNQLVTYVFWAQAEDGPAHRQQRANDE